MAKKRKPAAALPDSGADVGRDADKPSFDALVATSHLTRGALTTRQYADTMLGAGVAWTEHFEALTRRLERVKAGDLSGVEAMLLVQANTLDTMFNALATRAAQNMGQYMGAMDTYARLALKAQAQCRATLEALAEIKNPRPVSFVKQANIANGPQQVNNSSAPPGSLARAEESTKPTNELLTDDHGTTLDGGAAGETGRGNPGLETVDTRNGSGH
jgi:hypothetical protein